MYAALDLIMNRSPQARRSLVRFWYNLLTHLDHDAVMLLMNYGYADAGDPPDQPPEFYCRRLYEHVTAGTNLAGKDLLEIGSGRGGGAAHLTRTRKPRSYLGIDLAAQAAHFCQHYHQIPGLRFIPGDAEALPLAPASCDAVLSIESSHTYGSMAAFLGEVERVLRPGGLFLFTDYRDAQDLPTLRAQLRATGLQLVRETAISAAVVRALDYADAQKRALINQKAPSVLRPRFERFAALHGTSTYDGFANGRLQYWSFVFAKIL